VRDPRILWGSRSYRKLEIFVTDPRILCGSRSNRNLETFWLLVMFWALHFCRKLEIFMAVWGSFKIRMIFAHSIDYTFRHLREP
jgi:hypothetical protein